MMEQQEKILINQFIELKKNLENTNIEINTNEYNVFLGMLK